MVRAKLLYYYTFKAVEVKTPNEGTIAIVECHKWEEATGEHVDIYKVRPGIDWMGCSCPAYRRCKHQNCVDEAIADGRIQELWKWRWDEKAGWTELKDIQPIEELQP